MSHMIDGDTIDITNPLEVTEIAKVGGGSTPYHAISASSDNATLVKAGVSELCGINVSNSNAAARYIKFYNKATAPVSTDTPVLTVYIPATSSINKLFSFGLAFTLGLGFRMTTGIADGDTGTVGTDLSIDFDYK
jgi:hypothetical protein